MIAVTLTVTTEDDVERAAILANAINALSPPRTEIRIDAPKHLHRKIEAVRLVELKRMGWTL